MNPFQVSTVSFSGAALWQYESMRAEATSVMRGVARSFESRVYKAGSYRQRFNQLWNDLNPGQKVTYGQSQDVLNNL